MTVKYSKDHQWIATANLQAATVGITPFAQESLGDVVFVDLPAVGKVLAAGDVAAVVESVKTAADVFAPVAGVVVEVNETLRADPALANSAPLEAGWFFRMQVSEPAQLDTLLDADAYASLTQNG